MTSGRRTYSEEDKEHAVALYVEIGPAAAEIQTGIAKSTIIKWAKLAGVNGRDASEARATALASAGAIARRVNERKREDAYQKRIDRLSSVAYLAIERELQILVKMDDPKPEHLQMITNARNKAIHDLQLLLGKATSMDISNAQEHQLEMVKMAFHGALVDEGLSSELIGRISAAFAHRIRMAAAGEAPSYGPSPEVVGELEAGRDVIDAEFTVVEA